MAIKTYSMGIRIEMDVAQWPRTKDSNEEHASELAGTVVTLHKQRLENQLAVDLFADLTWGGGRPPEDYLCQNHCRVKVRPANRPDQESHIPCPECLDTYITPIPFGELGGGDDI